MNDWYSLYSIACERISDRIREAEREALIARSRSGRAATIGLDRFAKPARRPPDA
jgi:hypothetical protein